MEPRRLCKVFGLIAFFIHHCKRNFGEVMKHVAFLAAVCASPAFGWQEPARGSADRAALMDALRPHAVWQLGGPVEFVIDTLRVEGRFGFAMVQPQRPGGVGIDLAHSPMGLRDPEIVDYMDGTTMQALYEKSGETWVAVHWAIGATDAWFTAPEFCAAYRPVLADVCN